jgi:hypothetical protein
MGHPGWGLHNYGDSDSSSQNDEPYGVTNAVSRDPGRYQV